MGFTNGLTSLSLNLLASFVYDLQRNRNKTVESIADKAIEETCSHSSVAFKVEVDKNELKNILFSDHIESDLRNFSILDREGGINRLVARFASLSSFYIPDETKKIELIIKIFEYLFRILERLVLTNPDFGNIYQKRYQELNRKAEQEEHKRLQVDIQKVHELISHMRDELGDSVAEKIATLVGRKILNKKDQPEPMQREYYPKIQDYLARKICSAENYRSSMLSLFTDTMSRDLVNLVKQNKRITLLGDAGIGKSMELEHVANYFSDDDSHFYPFIANIKNYSVYQSLAEHLSPSWEQVQEDRLLVILDGLDEIESKHRNDAIRQIESFAERYSQCHMLISCRTNFYESETSEWSGSLNGFTSFVLLNLDNKEIGKYIETKLGHLWKKFEDSIFASKLEELTKIPFYLVGLVELFKCNADRGLPKNRAEIFEQLLELRMKKDIEHFKNTIALREKKKKIAKTLERTALGMEALGRNFITDEEFQQFVPNEDLRMLITYCTAFKKTEGETITWQFEHNNFQEFLAARALSKQSFEAIKDFVAFLPKHQKTKPSWLNTLSFLISILDEGNELFADLMAWIINIEPVIVVRFEPDRIEKATRLRLFNRIFDDYKSKCIWINRDKFPLGELARFGQADETTEFLLNEIKNSTHYTTLSNAIRLLGLVRISHRQRHEATECLVNYAIDSSKGTHAQRYALIALSTPRAQFQGGD